MNLYVNVSVGKDTRPYVILSVADSERIGVKVDVEDLLHPSPVRKGKLPRLRGLTRVEPWTVGLYYFS